MKTLDEIEERLTGPASVAALEEVAVALRGLLAEASASPAWDDAQLRRVGVLLRGWGEWGRGWHERLGDFAPPVTYDASGRDVRPERETAMVTHG